MYDFSNLGNIEFTNCLIYMHYVVYGFSPDSFDMRTVEWTKVTTEYLSKLLNISPLVVECPKQLPERVPYDPSINISELYAVFIEEAINRGLDYNSIIGDILESDIFRDWQVKMKNTPTFIREINPTNFFGGEDISYCDDEIMGFDPPVREACNILNEKGYKTYWSSANIQDILKRLGHAVKDIHAAYILIGAESLTDELKEILKLDGKCNFWGFAYNQSDNGAYYGIWAEITSLDMECSKISDILSQKALKLPSLINENIKVTKLG